MHLSSLLTKSQIILEMRASQHDDAIEELVDYLKSSDFLSSNDTGDIVSSLLEREDKVSSGIGSGVAIPHTFSSAVEEVVAVLGRSQEGVDFEALDNAPVKLIVLLIVPEDQPQQHLQTMAAIARLLGSCGLRKSILTAENKQEILNLFSSGECEGENNQ